MLEKETVKEEAKAKVKANDPQGVKWLITINNPIEKGFDHERIKMELLNLKSLVYGAMVDEKGVKEETPHTHIFIACTSAVRFSTLQKLFDSKANLQRAYGSSAENRIYLLKQGKWAETEKAETTIEGSFEEWGEMPAERLGRISIESMILERIQDGATNAEILLAFPHYLRGMRDVEYVRQTLRAQEYRDKWRELENVYIWGNTGVGKTRSIMDKYGYPNVYAVNNYKHPFDGYAGENVMLFDEFNSQFRMQDMNNYLDGYPLTLPARYSNKQACYDKTFIISNLDLRYQYKSEQTQQPEVWAAFTRRINKVVRFMADGTRREYTTKDYLSSKGENDGAWIELPADTPMPFDNDPSTKPTPTKAEQIPLIEN